MAEQMSGVSTSGNEGESLTPKTVLYTGAVDGQRDSKRYDFRRPDKFSKDHLRALQTVHETFCRLVGSALSSYLRLATRVDLLSVDQVSYGEYIDQIASPSTIHVMTLDPLPGRVLLDINMGLALSMIDRLLGGSGRPIQRTREFTEIESNLLQRLVGNLSAPYGEAWGNVIPISPKVIEMALNPQYVQIALPGDSAALLRFQVQMSGQNHTMSLCLPYATLEPLIGQLTPRNWLGGERRGEHEGRNIEERLQQVTAPVIAVLGRMHIELRDLLALEVGNILVLDTSTPQQLDIRIGDQLYCRGVPGLVGQHVAVQIREFSVREE